MMTLGMLTGLASLITAAYAQTTILFNENIVTSDTNVAVRERMLDKPITLESYVREYFTDEPVLAEIARCESTFRHLDRDGRILRGKANRNDVGVMQINEIYHGDKADALGFDIYTLEGNMGFAKYLYDKYGVKPWQASAPCWNNSNSWIGISER